VVVDVVVDVEVVVVVSGQHVSTSHSWLYVWVTLQRCNFDKRI
jgi:hypothetical protein